MCCGSAALAVCSVRICEVFHYCVCALGRPVDSL